MRARISTTKVYVGNKGKPNRVFIDEVEYPEGTKWSFGSTTNILTITATHSKSGAVTILLLKWKFSGDVNDDGVVNVLDLARLGKAYGATPTDPNWDKETDINSDNIINVLDLATVGKNYGKTA